MSQPDASTKRKKPFIDRGGLEYINRIMEKINSTHDLNVVARDIVDIMADALDCLGGAIFIVDPKYNVLRAYDYSRMTLWIEKVIPILPKEFRDYYYELDLKENLTVRTVNEKKMFVGNNCEDFFMPVLSKFISNALQRAVGLKTIATAPAIINDKVMGVLMVGFREKELPEEKRKLLEFFSNQCAVAIKNAQEYQLLKYQYEKMEEILQQQSDFIAVTAHEFRTPLSIAAFQLEEILESEGDINGHRDEIKVVEYTIENLKQLTERLFTVQQYDLNKVDLDLKEVEIKDFVTRLYAEFYPIMHEKQIKFKFEDELESAQVLIVDPVQIRQVLHNLLKNASKFTHKKGRVTLCLKKERGKIRIQVKDNGAGIPDALKKSIFDKFRTKSRGSGIGLGLYLCKKIIGLHGGKIWVEDNKKNGSNFIIELPIKAKK